MFDRIHGFTMFDMHVLELDQVYYKKVDKTETPSFSTFNMDSL